MPMIEVSHDCLKTAVSNCLSNHYILFHVKTIAMMNSFHSNTYWEGLRFYYFVCRGWCIDTNNPPLTPVNNHHACGSILDQSHVVLQSDVPRHAFQNGAHHDSVFETKSVS
jgi:hypothetical protein